MKRSHITGSLLAIAFASVLLSTALDSLFWAYNTLQFLLLATVVKVVDVMILTHRETRGKQLW